jgi:hypothetical protein
MILATRKWLLWAFVVSVASIVLFVLGVAAYAAHMRATATALVESARGIRTTADAEREIAAWRNRFGEHFWEESDHLGGDHNYDGTIDNLSLARLHMVQPMAVTLGLTIRDAELRNVALLLQTGRPNSAIWLQEWFDADTSGHFHVVRKNFPKAAFVEFSVTIPETERLRVFKVNTNCFLLFRTCKEAEDLLPSVWQLDTNRK